MSRRPEFYPSSSGRMIHQIPPGTDEQILSEYLTKWSAEYLEELGDDIVVRALSFPSFEACQKALELVELALAETPTDFKRRQFKLKSDVSGTI